MRSVLPCESILAWLSDTTVAVVSRNVDTFWKKRSQCGTGEQVRQAGREEEILEWRGGES